MTRYFGCTAVAFALVVGTGAVRAQTVITREITTEPVETIIERGPTGTVITRRPLEASVPGSPARLQADTFVSEPVETIVERHETTGVSATSAVPAAAPAPIRSTAVQRSVARPVPARPVPGPGRRHVQSRRNEPQHRPGRTRVPTGAPRASARRSRACRANRPPHRCRSRLDGRTAQPDLPDRGAGARRAADGDHRTDCRAGRPGDRRAGHARTDYHRAPGNGFARAGNIRCCTHRDRPRGRRARRYD